MTPHDYRRAEQMLKHHRAELVSGIIEQHVWSEKPELLWYHTARGTATGYFVVDPIVGIPQPAFDHSRLTTALATAWDTPVEPISLRVTTLEPGDHVVVVGPGGRSWRCSLDDYECAPVERAEIGPGESRSPGGRCSCVIPICGLGTVRVPRSR